MLQYQAGDAVALELLFQRHYLPVFRYAMASVGCQEDAEDITAQVFISAFRGLRRYRPGKASLEAWIFRIAHNEVKNHFRRARRQPPAVPLSEDGDQAAGHDPALEHRAELRDVADALKELPERQREAIVLRLVSGLSVRETAKVMKRPEGTVRSLVHHGIKALRSRLEANDE